MSENGQPYASRPSSYPQPGSDFCDATAVSTGCRGRVSTKRGKHFIGSIADRRVELQSRGAARAPVTTLITSAVAAIHVLIVRMGVSSELLHYAPSTAGCSRIPPIAIAVGLPDRSFVNRID